VKVDIYKRNQGRYTRGTTWLVGMAIVVAGAGALSEQLVMVQPVVRYGIPTVLVLLAAGGLFWLVNRQKNADFLIATESEMKKVSWSSKREIIGSTKVVIVTALILAAVLFAVDQMFYHVFRFLNIVEY
jgi:preprotein translocase subunit SecE